MAQLMPLPLTVSCFSKIQIGFTILVPADLGSPGKEPLNGCVLLTYFLTDAGWLFVCSGRLWQSVKRRYDADPTRRRRGNCSL